MNEKQTWKQFKDNGLLWWVNMILHTFGWVIIFEMNREGEIINVYPAKTKFRGFDNETNTEGYKKMEQTLKESFCKEL